MLQVVAWPLSRVREKAASWRSPRPPFSASPTTRPTRDAVSMRMPPHAAVMALP